MLLVSKKSSRHSVERTINRGNTSTSSQDFWCGPPRLLVLILRGLGLDDDVGRVGCGQRITSDQRKELVLLDPLCSLTGFIRPVVTQIVLFLRPRFGLRGRRGPSQLRLRIEAIWFLDTPLHGSAGKLGERREHLGLEVCHVRVLR